MSDATSGGDTTAPHRPVPPEEAGGTPEESAGAVPSPYGFLAPPQSAGEIGRLGPYRVLRVLGRGGMGVVFEAEDGQLQRRVALKAMLPHVAEEPTNRERFLREARAAAALDHENVVPVFQVGEDRGVPFLAMPLLQGETLADRLKREAPLTAGEVLRVGREAALGLAAAHAAGIVHRDVKPGNLWLEGPPGGPVRRVRVLDFGLARRPAGESITQSGALVGTPAYMAPEQARGKAVDARADLFSLGCVLYHMATGEPPFGNRDLYAVLGSLFHDTPEPAERKNAALPPALCGLVAELLSKDPAGRPTSAAGVAGRLQAIERGEDGLTTGNATGGGAGALRAAQPDAPAVPERPPADRTFVKDIWATGLVFVVVGLGLVFLSRAVGQGTGSLYVFAFGGVGLALLCVGLSFLSAKVAARLSVILTVLTLPPLLVAALTGWLESPLFALVVGATVALGIYPAWQESVTRRRFSRGVVALIATLLLTAAVGFYVGVLTKDRLLLAGAAVVLLILWLAVLVRLLYGQRPS